MSIRFNSKSSVLRICIDSIHNNCISGSISGQRLSSPIYFSDINDFIVQIDALFDIQKFPKAFQKIRSFTNKRLPSVPATLTTEEMKTQTNSDPLLGKHITFLLNISSRQNASWQGVVDWMDGNENQHFKSTLEFIRLLLLKLEI